MQNKTLKVMVVKDRNIHGKFVKDFCNMLSELGHQVSFVFDSYKQQKIPNFFNANVQITNLSQKSNCYLKNIFIAIRSIFQTPSFRYARAINLFQPDIIVCYFIKDLYNITFLHNHNIPIVLMVHNYPPIFFSPLLKKPIKSFIYKKQLKKACAYNLLLKSFSGIIGQNFHPAKEYIIGNIIDQIPEAKRTNLQTEKKKIIYIGRIDEKQKRQHLLIDAFGLIAKDFPYWSIEFWGAIKHPTYHTQLQSKITELNISNQVFFKGFSDDIKSVYCSADIIAWPAKYEGLSIALADGMAHGLPSIGFAESPSVNEVITNNKNGFLATSVEDFSTKLAILMKNKNLRIEFGANAAQSIEQYSPHIIATKWQNLLNEIMVNK